MDTGPSHPETEIIRLKEAVEVGSREPLAAESIAWATDILSKCDAYLIDTATLRVNVEAFEAMRVLASAYQRDGADKLQTFALIFVPGGPVSGDLQACLYALLIEAVPW